MLQRLLRRAKPNEERGPLYEAVEEAMREVKIYAQSHGGDIELVSVDEAGVVRVRLHGACRICPLSTVTLKLGVSEQLRRLVPGVSQVEQV